MESQRLFLGRIIDPLLNAVFPRYCVSCKAEGELLCSVCFASFTDHVFKVEADHLTMFAYGNPVIRDLIKAYKYDFDHSALRLLERLAQPKMKEVGKFIGESILVPVPLSSLRLRERGFNQAEEIARWVSGSINGQTKNLLQREERAGHQAERTPLEREQAMKASPFRFASSPSFLRRGLGGGLEPRALRGPEVNVVLVDDVWTTGSTLRAAEQTLNAAGVKSVRFLTLAKG